MTKYLKAEMQMERIETRTAKVASSGTVRPRSRTLADLLDEIAEATPDALAAVGRGRRLLYKELAADSKALAASLAGKFRVRRGDRIALLCSNRLEWLIVAFAAARLGAPLVAISTWSKATEIEHLLQHERPNILVTLDRFRGNDYLETWKELLPELWETSPESFRSLRFPTLRNVILIQSNELSGVSNGICRETEVSAAHRFCDVLQLGQAMEPLPENWASAVDIALVLYTSGSSARPKAVPLLHYGCVENGFNIGERQGLRASDRGWLTLPLCWSYGSVITLMSLMTHGAAAVLQEGFDAGEALDLIEGERCTGYYGQANMLHALIEHPSFRPERTATFRTGLTTGTPDDIRLTAEVLGARGVCTIYGLTEVYGNCAVANSSDPIEWRMHGQGKPLPGVTMRVVDPNTGTDVPTGELGEFWIKGYVMPGYLDDPEQTSAAFTADGFFRSGDLGTIDSDGYVHFQGRSKEIIKTGGINVSPLEIEDFLQSCKGVAHACVVGIPHKIKGEVVAALVRPSPNATLTEDELRTECRARMASYKVPEIFLIVDELPTTDTGKLSRRKALGIAVGKSGLS